MTTVEAPPESPVKVGDFFYTSWGYDQTNVEYYEVVGLTPSGKSVRLREVRQAVIEGSFGSVVPVPGAYIGDEVITKRLSLGGYKDAAVRFSSYRYGWLWDGKPKYDTYAAGQPGH